MPSMAFSKPRSNAPTRHLFVGNAGPAVGDTEERLRGLFSEFGQVAALQVPEGRSHVFVSFATEEQGFAAMEALRGAPSAADGRVLVVKYSDRKEEETKEPPVVCLTSEQMAIPGLSLIPDFVSEQEEKELLGAVDSEEDKEGAWEELARRRVLHYGYVFHYVTRNIDPEQRLGPLPAFLQDVKGRIEALPPVGMELDQVTVNEYPRGVGLSAHIDTHSAFTGAIVSLSLAGDTVMELRRGESDRRRILLPRRSLLVLAGEARYAWAHYIPHRKSDNVNGEDIPRAERRVSFTFRKARGFACCCDFPEHCDSQASTLPPTRMAQKLEQLSQQENLLSEGNEAAAAAAAARGVEGDRGASSEGGALDEAAAPVSVEAELEALEAKHVHEVYDAIAPHFSSTRVAVWPKVREFIEGLEPGAVLVDAGCGNGKYFGVRRDIAVIASDRSKGLVSQARRRIAPDGSSGAAASERSLSVRASDLSEAECSPAADVCVADAMRLPLRSGTCDALVCVAVLHHMSSPERRVRTLAELARVLKPGGRLLVTVWAQEQENQKKLAKWHPITTPAGGTCSEMSQEEPPSTAPAPEGSSSISSSSAQGGEGEQRDGDNNSSNNNNGALADGDGGDYFVPWHLPFHRTEAASVLHSALSSAGAGGGGQINHQKGSVMFQRYYHLFREGELSRLGSEVEGCAVEQEFFDCSNWCMIMRKL